MKLGQDKQCGRKSLSILLGITIFILCLILGSVSAFATEDSMVSNDPDEEEVVIPIVPGDSNGDGIVNGVDITRLRKYLAAIEQDPLTPPGIEISEGADVNEDGKIDRQDLRILLNSLSNYDEEAEEDEEEPVVKLGFYIEDDCVYYYDQDGLSVTNRTVLGYRFGSDGILVANNVFIVIGGDTYFIQNNRVVHGYRIIQNRIYYFDESGIMIKNMTYEENTFGEQGYVTGDNVFVVIEGDTYYLRNNTVLYQYQIINEHVYYFGDDGKLQKDIVVDENTIGPEGYVVGDYVFVVVEGDTYCIINNVIVYSYQIINNHIYYFGNDGKMVIDTTVDDQMFGPDGYIVGNEVFVVIEGDTYYIINDIIVYNYQIINNHVYYFGDDGKMREDTVVDGNTIGSDGYIVGDNIFVIVEDDTYCIINNVIAYGYHIINNYIYYFGDDGKMYHDTIHDDHNFGSNGYIEGDQIFIIIEGDTYCIINNVVVYSYQIVNNHIYYFGNDGKMQKDTTVDNNHFGSEGYIEGDKVFVIIEGNTYYITNNIIVYDYQIINNHIYYFGDDGKMREDTVVDGNTIGSDGYIVGDNIFVIVEGNTYCIINNVIIYNYHIINNYIYYFGDDGKMYQDTTHDGYYFGQQGYIEGDQIFIVIGGDTYCIINNVVVYGYQIVNNRIYYFGNDGKMQKDTTVDNNHFGSEGYIEGDKVFVVIEGNTYYITNNVIVYDYQIINNHIYYFGNDGKMVTNTTIDDKVFGSNGYVEGDNILVIVEGDTYCIVDNVIYHGYRIVNYHIYYFGEDGRRYHDTNHDGYQFGPDGSLVGDQTFIVIEGNTYYITNNIIVHDFYEINNYVYYFGTDGRLQTNVVADGYTVGPDGYVIDDQVFIIAGGNTYYIINNIIVFDYQIINNRIYYFGTDGVMLVDGYHDGYYFGNTGYIVVETTTRIIIDNVEYWILPGGNAYQMFSLSGYVEESDLDYDNSNNAKLAGVLVTVTVNGETYTARTDANGYYYFEQLPNGEITITFEKNGYYDVIQTMSGAQDMTLNVVMDLEVSNTLSGRVMIADTDTNYSNNTPLAGALVIIERVSSTNSFHYECYTGNSGDYQFVGLTAGVYKITVVCDGYLPIEQTLVVRHNESIVQNLVIEAIRNNNVNDGYASGTIYDARTGNSVPGMTLVIREGIGNTTGEVLMTLTTDSSGTYRTDALAPGNYTVQLIDERDLDNEDQRYGSIVFTIKVMSDTTISNQNATTSNSVGIDADSIRIVLTWGATPSDLDSHLYADMESTSDYHVYFSNKVVADAQLDVDDTSSYGPETTTIETIRDGVYKFYVHDYSGGSNSSSTNLKNSGACVKVYLGSAATPAYTFYAPNALGLYWHVFTYNSITGDFIVVNTIGNSAGY